MYLTYINLGTCCTCKLRSCHEGAKTGAWAGVAAELGRHPRRDFTSVHVL